MGLADLLKDAGIAVVAGGILGFASTDAISNGLIYLMTQTDIKPDFSQIQNAAYAQIALWQILTFAYCRYARSGEPKDMVQVMKDREIARLV